MRSGMLGSQMSRSMRVASGWRYWVLDVDRLSMTVTFAPAVDEGVDQMGTDETGPASHQSGACVPLMDFVGVSQFRREGLGEWR